MSSPVGVDDRHDPAERVGADGDKPGLALGVWILSGEAGGVRQGEFGVLEGETVPGEVGARLGGVPVGLHGADYMY